MGGICGGISRIKLTRCKFKKFVHEGGIATPLIAHWPGGITAQGKIVNQQYFHFIDVMPTLLEVARAEYPSEYNGKDRTPLEGVSMLRYMQNPDIDSKEDFFPTSTSWSNGDIEIHLAG